VKPSERLNQIVATYQRDYPEAGVVPSWHHHWCAIRDYLDEQSVKRERMGEPPGMAGTTTGGGIVTTADTPSIAQLREDVDFVFESFEDREGICLKFTLKDEHKRLRAALNELEAWRAL
jgi:hypothetical protein